MPSRSALTISSRDVASVRPTRTPFESGSRHGECDPWRCGRNSRRVGSPPAPGRSRSTPSSPAAPDASARAPNWVRNQRRMLPPPAFIRSTAHRSALTYGPQVAPRSRPDIPRGPSDRIVVFSQVPVPTAASPGSRRPAPTAAQIWSNAPATTAVASPSPRSLAAIGGSVPICVPGATTSGRTAGGKGEVGNEVAHPGALADVPRKPTTSGRRVGHGGQSQPIEDQLAPAEIARRARREVRPVAAIPDHASERIEG